MRILITGIPGTGKTTIGNYLAEQMGYLHFDVERHGFYSINDFLCDPNNYKVISWGFYPGQDDSNIQQLINLGFQMIWFDGNRESALNEFNKRGTVPEHLFHAQIDRIDGLDLDRFQHHVFNPFSTDGSFMSKEEIVMKIFKIVKRDGN
jgi:gluconate kinase